MHVTSEVAQASLAEVDEVVSRTRKAVAGRGTDLILMVWGGVWIVCYVATHLLVVNRTIDWIGPVWWIGVAIGIAGMFVILGLTKRHAPVRSEHGKRIGRRVFWSWFALFVFADAWLVLLWPWSPLQMNAFLVTVIMFAYVMIGLWMSSRFFLVLGLGVAAAAVAGYLLTMAGVFKYYNLWMAAAGGGALFASGLYIRRAWK